MFFRFVLQNSKHYTSAEISEKINLLLHWDDVKKHSPADYRYRKKFVVVDFPGSKLLAYRSDIKASSDHKSISVVDASSVRVILPIEQVFDAIREAHSTCGHGKVRATWMKCKEKSVIHNFILFF